MLLTIAIYKRQRFVTLYKAHELHSTVPWLTMLISNSIPSVTSVISRFAGLGAVVGKIRVPSTFIGAAFACFRFQSKNDGVDP